MVGGRRGQKKKKKSNKVENKDSLCSEIGLGAGGTWLLPLNACLILGEAFNFAWIILASCDHRIFVTLCHSSFSEELLRVCVCGFEHVALTVQRLSAFRGCWSVSESTQLAPAADRAAPKLCELTLGLVQDDVDANWFLRLWLLGGLCLFQQCKLGFRLFALTLDVDRTAEEKTSILYRLMW